MLLVSDLLCTMLILIYFLYTWVDMRKALSRDVNHKSVVPLDHPVRPEEVD